MARAEASRKRCALYTRKSSEEGLEQEFNSLAAQCEACEAFIRSQRNEGWVLVRTRYDDGGFSGGKWNKSVNRQGGCRTRIGSTLHHKIDAHCESCVLSRAIP